MAVELELLSNVSNIVWEMVLKAGLDDPYYWTTMHAIICIDNCVIYPIVLEGVEYALIPGYEWGMAHESDLTRIELFMREQGYTRVDY